MSEMIERVAVAIGAKLTPALSGGPAVSLTTIARATIEAMREPTTMMAKVSTVFPEDDDWSNGSKNSTDVWQAMIDEALK